ncbi:hypothetical protein VTK56DRAFT_3065 [Thermocarpiscus australiensis]
MAVSGKQKLGNWMWICTCVVELRNHDESQLECWESNIRGSVSEWIIPRITIGNRTALSGSQDAASTAIGAGGMLPFEGLGRR